MPLFSHKKAEEESLGIKMFLTIFLLGNHRYVAKVLEIEGVLINE